MGQGALSPLVSSSLKPDIGHVSRIVEHEGSILYHSAGINIEVNQELRSQITENLGIILKEISGILNDDIWNDWVNIFDS
ncbi:hypothetical protein B7P43_G18057 [Cryptotermes secundus]|uniref:Uncharacterized protein n=1 Tax=Cryptotermes secundus TaxID=105785 RepID=A0A2J7REV0_9NEOP|nr:hypothetical protein B7P43_G18057 [Cryptotermes secundus]